MKTSLVCYKLNNPIRLNHPLNAISQEITEEKEEKKESKAKESKTKADKSGGKIADLD